MDYYNTTEIKETELHHIRSESRNQEDLVIKYMQLYPGRNWSPSEIWIEVFNRKEGILNSVRRAITNLTSKGKIFKTNKQREGPYGRPEYIWTIEKPFTNQLEIF